MPSQDQFFETKIKGITFRGEVTRFGPYLLAYQGREQIGWVPFAHHIEIYPIVDDQIGDPDDREAQWHVCKWDSNQRAIELAGFTREDLAALSKAVGIRVFDRPADSVHLYGSEAWAALKDWTVKHPKLFASAGDDYCRGWKTHIAAKPDPEEVSAPSP